MRHYEVYNEKGNIYWTSNLEDAQAFVRRVSIKKGEGYCWLLEITSDRIGEYAQLVEV